MQFITVQQVDEKLGSDWAELSKKQTAVKQANAWLNTKNFCSGIEPLSESILDAAILLSQEAALDKLYQTRSEGVVSESKVKADTVEVTEKYVTGMELGLSSNMQLVEALIYPFLCRGGSFNTWVCK